ncbi:MAG: hypothetical protein BWX56_01597 [Euryarchaeota archaeon ADurb.Bin023]|nr:MAG: hypothetical protein BWX56_01597 [Euryarchaeota archaeon ADurb.Bin023]
MLHVIIKQTINNKRNIIDSSFIRSTRFQAHDTLVSLDCFFKVIAPLFMNILSYFLVTKHVFCNIEKSEAFTMINNIRHYSSGIYCTQAGTMCSTLSTISPSRRAFSKRSSRFSRKSFA